MNTNENLNQMILETLKEISLALDNITNAYIPAIYKEKVNKKIKKIERNILND